MHPAKVRASIPALRVHPVGGSLQGILNPPDRPFQRATPSPLDVVTQLLCRGHKVSSQRANFHRLETGITDEMFQAKFRIPIEIPWSFVQVPEEWRGQDHVAAGGQNAC